ncbi:MAG: ArsA family ATPase [Myxococcota bacterium]|nr:ArsA family ATPase [Myxococcota bacterium]
MRLVFYTGKGGVGKTTTAAATAAYAAACGRRTLVLSADPAHSLGDVLGVRLDQKTTTPLRVAPGLDALEVDSRATLDPHWGAIRDYLVSLFRHQGIYDLCIVDCAPTGSTLRLVTLPEVASRAVKLLLRVQRAVATLVSPVARVVVPVPLPGPEVFRDIDRMLYERLAKLRERLLEADTSVRIVVTPERMVIDEALRAHTDLALFELACDAVVMNRLYPAEAAAEAFFESWGRLQEERLAEVEESFAPLPVLRAPLAREEVVGVAALAAHGAAIFADADPAAVLCVAPRLRFARGKGEYRVELPLPHARKDALDVAKLDDALLVRTGNRRRAIPLPRKLAALALVGAKLDAGVLTVRLGTPR